MEQEIKYHPIDTRFCPIIGANCRGKDCALSIKDIRNEKIEKFQCAFYEIAKSLQIIERDM